MAIGAAHNPADPPSRRRFGRDARIRALVFAGAAILFFFALGGHDLWAPDEPYFAEGAREMVVDGQWAVPHVNGKITTDKPPLFFWLIALFSLPGGAVTPWLARLPSALAALGTLGLAMRLGLRHGGHRVAALTGGVLATTYLFWEKARWSQTDALLCCLIWVALSAFESFREGRSGGTRAGLLFWLAAALAVLTKGPVGLLLPLGIALAVLAWDGELRLWRRFAPFAGPLLLAAVVGAWAYAAMAGSGGEYSVFAALKEHFVDRGIHGLHHKRPFWYFFKMLPADLLPWSGLAPGAMVLAWRRRTRTDRLLLTAAIFVFAFFSVSTEKRGLYLLPAFPAFALMVARLGARFTGTESHEEPADPPLDRRWFTIGQGGVAVLFAVVGLALPIAAQRQPDLPFWMVLTLASVFFVAGAATLQALRSASLRRALLTPALGMSAASLLIAAVVYPALEPRKSARPFSLVIQEESAASRAQGRPVLAYDLGNLPEAFALYTDGLYTLETSDPEVLARHLARPERVYAVVNEETFARMDRQIRDRTRVVSSTVLSRRKVSLVHNRAPLCAPATAGTKATTSPCAG